jgi:hypothetical protein
MLAMVALLAACAPLKTHATYLALRARQAIGALFAKAGMPEPAPRRAAGLPGALDQPPCGREAVPPGVGLMN